MSQTLYFHLFQDATMTFQLEFMEKRHVERVVTRIQVEVKEIGPEEIISLFKGSAYSNLSEPHPEKRLSPKDAVTTFTQNISVGGLMLLSEAPMKVGTPLALAVQLPEVPLPIHTLALVVWSIPEASPEGPYASGLRFLAISKDDIAKVNRYVVMQKQGEAAKRSQK